MRETLQEDESVRNFVNSCVPAQEMLKASPLLGQALRHLKEIEGDLPLISPLSEQVVRASTIQAKLDAIEPLRAAVAAIEKLEAAAEQSQEIQAIRSRPPKGWKQL